ncbi:type IV pilus major pilin [Vibrio cholerae]|uniref:type IV pilus major pilin n=1 Tax=Vibrio cholerae TaxID=666 RepID=UPI0002A3B109|nr:type IV pilus major pilin [Vibrio cholerae]EKG0018384.1 type IV pilus major pilin [Vibrio cholerae]EKY32220.1 Toxin co-regulated pilin A [Vibrio cholerae PS15]ELA3029820.1 type IV pilus major pilin [Vibrio cholerae]ELN7715018.1 type IV pilus major pilin [Vibrio cholerae]QKV03390.1 type IV pilus major pilin [Vibrio cholerae]
MKAFEFFSAKRQQFAQRAQAAFAQYKEAKKQRGMTLLEVIIVLGIIGTIAAGVVVLAQRAFDSRTLSEVVQTTNTIRVAMKDAYSNSGSYPDYKAEVLSLDNQTILTNKQAGATATLVQLGKLSVSEARNKISGDFYAIGAASTTTGDGKTNKKGFAMEINGLTSEQCRNILTQVGNNWDYVAVGTSAAGTYSLSPSTAVDMAAASSTSGPVLRSLANNGTAAITPDVTVNVCSNAGASNSIILGSR